MRTAPRQMKQVKNLPALLGLALLSCLGGEPAAPGDPEAGPEAGFDEPIGGGTLALEGCGYSVTTRDGASAPRPAADRLGPDPTPFAVHLGVSGDPARTINVVWRTRDDQTLSTRVQLGEGDALDRTIGGLSFFYETPGRPPVRVHEAHLCGLKPGTRYSYRVGGKEGEREVWSPTYSFRTAPDMNATPAATVLLGLIGDSRGGYSYLGQALKQMQALGPPDLILFSGDAVLLGTLQSEWEDFFAQAEPVLSAIPLVSAHGNHEINAINYYSQLALPGDEEDYGLDYGAAHLTVVNDSPADPADLSGRVVQFLDQDLGRDLGAARPWRLLLHHRPLYSAALNHGSDLELQRLFGPLIDKHRVDLDLAGHEHDYERTKPLRGGAPQAGPADGTTFIVSGGAGAELYQNGQGPWTELSAQTRNFVLLEVRGRSLAVRAYRDDGTPLDAFTLSKP